LSREPSADVAAVIVTYHPDAARVEAILQALKDDVFQVVVVDNNSRHFDEPRLRAAHPQVRIKRLSANKGIAAAQNEGIALARSVGAAFVLFLDQDSMPQPGMVATLLAATARLAGMGHRVGCVGPRTYFPGTKDLAAFGRLSWFGVRQQTCPDSNSVIECDMLVSSGMLIPMEALERVGGMEEGLFIDSVDTEWCFRAMTHGYRIFGACGAALEHRLGERALRIWLGRWRRLPRHRPFRYYYMFRNTFLLLGRRYMPVKWTLLQLERLIALFVVYGLFTLGRSGELRMMLKGLVDGVRGHTGALPE
jgi:rhamnosyltransferase